MKQFSLFLMMIAIFTLLFGKSVHYYNSHSEHALAHERSCHAERSLCCGDCSAECDCSEDDDDATESSSSALCKICNYKFASFLAVNLNVYVSYVELLRSIEPSYINEEGFLLPHHLQPRAPPVLPLV